MTGQQNKPNFFQMSRPQRTAAGRKMLTDLVTGIPQAVQAPFDWWNERTSRAMRPRQSPLAPAATARRNLQQAGVFQPDPPVYKSDILLL